MIMSRTSPLIIKSDGAVVNPAENAVARAPRAVSDSGRFETVLRMNEHPRPILRSKHWCRCQSLASAVPLWFR
jgi:hypothetical protein